MLRCQRNRCKHPKQARLLDGNKPTSYNLPALTPGWQQVTVSLATLGVANQPNCTGFGIQGSIGTAQATFYVDDVELVAAPPPAVVHLGVDAGPVLGTVDARQFGLNTATWDGILGNSQTVPLLQTSKLDESDSWRLDSGLHQPAGGKHDDLQPPDFPRHANAILPGRLAAIVPRAGTALSELAVRLRR